MRTTISHELPNVPPETELQPELQPSDSGPPCFPQSAVAECVEPAEILVSPTEIPVSPTVVAISATASHPVAAIDVSPPTAAFCAVSEADVEVVEVLPPAVDQAGAFPNGPTATGSALEEPRSSFVNATIPSVLLTSDASSVPDEILEKAIARGVEVDRASVVEAGELGELPDEHEGSPNDELLGGVVYRADPVLNPTAREASAAKPSVAKGVLTSPVRAPEYDHHRTTRVSIEQERELTDRQVISQLPLTMTRGEISRGTEVGGRDYRNPQHPYRLFLGGLLCTVKEDEVFWLFEKVYGPGSIVHVRVALDKSSKQRHHKGYAFMVAATADRFQHILDNPIRSIKHKCIDIKIQADVSGPVSSDKRRKAPQFVDDPSNPLMSGIQQPMPDGPVGGIVDDGVEVPPSHKVSLIGVYPPLSETHLFNYFQQFGTILRITIIRSEPEALARGAAVICFNNSTPVEAICERHSEVALGPNMLVGIKPLCPSGMDVEHPRGTRSGRRTAWNNRNMNSNNSTQAQIPRHNGPGAVRTPSHQKMPPQMPYGGGHPHRNPLPYGGHPQHAQQIAPDHMMMAHHQPQGPWGYDQQQMGQQAPPQGPTGYYNGGYGAQPQRPPQGMPYHHQPPLDGYRNGSPMGQPMMLQHGHGGHGGHRHPAPGLHQGASYAPQQGQYRQTQPMSQPQGYDHPHGHMNGPGPGQQQQRMRQNPQNATAPQRSRVAQPGTPPWGHAPGAMNPPHS